MRPHHTNLQYRHPRAISRCGAFTLMEVLLASVILSMAVAALSHAIVSGQQHAYSSLARMRAAALAQAMLEEVSSKPYADNEGAVTLGPEAGESNRGLFDNMDDYHGLIQPAGELVDQAGEEYPAEYQTFSRQVQAAYQTLSIPGIGEVQGLQITVRVIDEHGQVMQMQRFVPKPTETLP